MIVQVTPLRLYLSYIPSDLALVSMIVQVTPLRLYPPFASTSHIYPLTSPCLYDRASDPASSLPTY